MSQRRALAREAWQRARAAGFPVVALARDVTVAHGLRPWRRFLDQAGNAELRAVVAALDHREIAQQTAGSPGGAATEE